MQLAFGSSSMAPIFRSNVGRTWYAYYKKAVLNIASEEQVHSGQSHENQTNLAVCAIRKKANSHQ